MSYQNKLSVNHTRAFESSILYDPTFLLHCFYYNNYMYDKTGASFDGEPLTRCGNYTDQDAAIWEVFIEEVEL